MWGIRRFLCCSGLIAFGAALAVAQNAPGYFTRHAVYVTPSPTETTNGHATLEYFDGLGRQFASISEDMTSGESSAVMCELDDRNNIVRQWQPLHLLLNGATSVASIMSALETASDDDSPYTDISYSQRLNPMETSRHRPGSIAHDSEGIRTAYSLNSASGENSCLNLTWDQTSGALRNNGYAEPATLRIVTTTDEDGCSETKFIDSRNREVATRLHRDGIIAETYYVYDHAGRLRYAISPMGMDMIKKSRPGLIDDSDPALSDFSHCYRYDGLGRQVYAKIPGADPVETVYDSRGLCAFIRDGNLKEKGHWLATAYDYAGRPSITAIISDPRNASELSEEMSKKQALAYFIGSSSAPLFGYANPWGEKCIADSVLTVTWHDDYRFIESIPGDSLKSAFIYSELPGYDSRSEIQSAARGRVTGTMSKILGANGHIFSAVYYDSRGKACREIHSCIDGSVVTDAYRRRLGGEPEIHSAQTMHNDGTVSTEVTAVEYDSFGRPTRSSVCIDGQKEIELFSHEYDWAGRLVSTGADGLSIKYDYDTSGRRNSMRASFPAIGKTASEGMIAESIDFENGSSEFPSFNGNVTAHSLSRIETKTGKQHSSHLVSHEFSYDGLNRLAAAVHSSVITGGRAPINDRGSKSTQYSYDLNGNLMSLYRGSDDTEPLDRVTFSRSGNKVIRAYDDAEFEELATDGTFRDGSDSRIEYTWDANGNMTSDLNSRISKITYSHLNLPLEVTMTDGRRIVYIHDANGRPLGERYLTPRRSFIADPIAGSLSRSASFPQIGSSDSLFHDLTESDFLTHFVAAYRERVGSRIYFREGNTKGTLGPRRLARLCFDGGYLADSVVNRYITDYRGSVIAVARQSEGVPSLMTYFPYGAPHSIAEDSSGAMPLTFEGKETELMHGLGWCDFGARRYDPHSASWMTPDPRSGELPGVSPYAYCAANPTRFVDPDGNSPVYNLNGIFLGNTREGFRGQVYIYMGDRYVNFGCLAERRLKPVLGDDIDTYDNVTKAKLLNERGHTNIWNHIIGMFHGKNLQGYIFSMSHIRNGRIGYIPDEDNNKKNPVYWNTAHGENAIPIISGSPVFMVSDNGYEGTVENIAAAVLYHEWLSHGVLNYGNNTHNHHLAYLNTINSDLWDKTTLKFKKHSRKNFKALLTNEYIYTIFSFDLLKAFYK